MIAAVTHPMRGAEAYTLAGDTTEMEAFLAALQDEVPADQITVTGAPLRIPSDLNTSPMPDALAAVPVTSVSDGIRKTLAHYRKRDAVGAVQ